MDVLNDIMGVTFETIKNHHFLFFGIPVMYLTVGVVFRVARILMMPPRRIWTERIELPAVSEKKLYVSPVLYLHKCPVSISCDKCRFCGTDRCLKSYL